MKMIVESSLLLLITVAGVVTADNGDISWATVGVTWALTTLTTIFIVAIMFSLRRVLRNKKKKHMKRREPGTRDSKRSTLSSTTRSTNFSQGTARGSGHAQLHRASKPSHMARSVSEEIDRQNRRKTGDHTSKWCTERGLNENTAKVLRRNGFIDHVTLSSLRIGDVPALGLVSKAEECVLRQVLMDMHMTEPLHIDVQETSISTNGTRERKTPSGSRKASSSDHGFAMAGPSQSSSHTGVSTPLLDRAQSYNDIDESYDMDTDGFHNKSSKSYEVIQEGRSRMFGASSEIKLPEAVEANTPFLQPTNTKTFNGLLSDKGLYTLAGDIGMEWQHLASLLGVPTPLIQQIKLDHVGNTRQQIHDMLRLWRDTARGTKEEIKGMLQLQLEVIGRRDVAQRLLKEQVHGSIEKVNFHSIV